MNSEVRGQRESSLFPERERERERTREREEERERVLFKVWRDWISRKIMGNM